MKRRMKRRMMKTCPVTNTDVECVDRFKKLRFIAANLACHLEELGPTLMNLNSYPEDRTTTIRAANIIPLDQKKKSKETFGGADCDQISL